MKRIYSTIIILTTLLLCLSLNSCSDNDPQYVDVSGTWYEGSITSNNVYDYTEYTLRSDASLIIIHTVANGDAPVNTQQIGSWGTDNDQIVLVPMGQPSFAYTLKEYSRSRLTLERNGATIYWHSSPSSLRK